MASIDIRDSYTIPIDGRWSLTDLYTFPRAYEQVYFALEAILPNEEAEANERIVRAFAAFPWQGGYSAVSFYNQLKIATPIKQRPVIRSMKYASPGWIELGLLVPLAMSVAKLVTMVAGSIESCNRTYNAIHKDLQERKLLRLEVEKKQIGLQRDELALIEHYSEVMAKMMDLPSAEAIHERSKDPLISLKILSSIYRRVRILAEYQNRKKVDFVGDQSRRVTHADLFDL